MVDQLASEYASQPVVFLEQLYNSPTGDRLDRFWAAHGGGYAGYPMVIVDSGHQWTDRLVTSDFYSTYKAAVDSELARAPQAEVTSSYTRVGDHYKVSVMVKNLSGVSLSASNDANLTVIVYEDIKVGVTNRYVRSADSLNFQTALANNTIGTYTIDTSNLVGVNWNNLHIIVLVEYRPSNSNVYDMLQAAVSTPGQPLSVPAGLHFLIDDAHPANQTLPISITGGELGLTWQITSQPSWLTITPPSGSTGAMAQATLLAASLPAPGILDGTITIQFSGGTVAYDPKTIAVTAYRGQVWYLNLPLIERGQ